MRAAFSFFEDLKPIPRFDPLDQIFHGVSSKCSRHGRAVATAREVWRRFARA